MNPDLLYKKILSHHPTEEQFEAIFTDLKAFVLRACPGSGKTWTAARRLCWRMANWNREYSIGGIALLSFTNAAVNEFIMTIQDLSIGRLLNEPHHISTLDSFIDQFLIKPFGHLVMKCANRPKLHLTPARYDYTHESYKFNKNIDDKIPRYVWNLEPRLEDGEIKFLIRQNNNNAIQIDNNICRQSLLCFAKNGWYTHSQRSLWAYLLLKNHQDLLKRLALRFPEIIIDECQDTSELQQAILLSLKDMGVHITFIGDPDQCIYEFNKAKVTLIEDLTNKHGMPVKTLTLNMRSNQNIIRVASSFCSIKNMKSSFSPAIEKYGAFILKYNNELELADLANKFIELQRQYNLEPNKTAILARGNSTIRKIKGELNLDSIKGSAGYFLEAAYLRDVEGNFRDAFNKLLIGMKKITKDFTSWDDLVRDRTVEQFKRVHILLWKFLRSPEQDGLPLLDLTLKNWFPAMRKSVANLLNKCNFAADGSLSNLLKGTGESELLNACILEQLKVGVSIRVDTIHQVKGESLDAVLLIGNAPFFNVVLQNRGLQLVPEEVRLAYVAMTRAKHLLLIALPAKHFDKNKDTWLSLGFKQLVHL
jgi:superfamily I DNA/RNA helicase